MKRIKVGRDGRRQEIAIVKVNVHKKGPAALLKAINKAEKIKEKLTKRRTTVVRGKKKRVRQRSTVSFWVQGRYTSESDPGTKRGWEPFDWSNPFMELRKAKREAISQIVDGVEGYQREFFSISIIVKTARGESFKRSAKEKAPQEIRRSKAGRRRSPPARSKKLKRGRNGRFAKKVKGRS